MHTDEVLYKISVIESSYQILNYKIYNRIIHTIFHKFMRKNNIKTPTTYLNNSF
jgi:hypothetical protein